MRLVFLVCTGLCLTGLARQSSAFQSVGSSRLEPIYAHSISIGSNAQLHKIELGIVFVDLPWIVECRITNSTESDWQSLSGKAGCSCFAGEIPRKLGVAESAVCRFKFAPSETGKQINRLSIYESNELIALIDFYFDARKPITVNPNVLMISEDSKEEITIQVIENHEGAFESLNLLGKDLVLKGPWEPNITYCERNPKKITLRFQCSTQKHSLQAQHHWQVLDHEELIYQVSFTLCKPVKFAFKTDQVVISDAIDDGSSSIRLWIVATQDMELSELKVRAMIESLHSTLYCEDLKLKRIGQQLWTTKWLLSPRIVSEIKEFESELFITVANNSEVAKVPFITK